MIPKMYIFDEIEDYTENYKDKIRGAEYDELVRAKTSESITFLFERTVSVNNNAFEKSEDTSGNNEAYHAVKVKFDVEFSFRFKDGFKHVEFSNLEFQYDAFNAPSNMIEMLTQYIKTEFIDVNRLSE